MTTKDKAPDWPALLRPAAMCSYLSIPKVRLYDLYNSDPTFPRQVRLSPRCVGWRRAAVDQWLADKEGAAEQVA